MRETTCRVSDAGHIVAGNDYEFRVVAINKGGESPNSPVSKAVHAKNRFVKPRSHSLRNNFLFTLHAIFDLRLF